MKTKQRRISTLNASETAHLGKQNQASARTDSLPRGPWREHTHHSAHSKRHVLGLQGGHSLQVVYMRFSDQLRELFLQAEEDLAENTKLRLFSPGPLLLCRPLCSAGLCPPQEGAGRGRSPGRLSRAPTPTFTPPLIRLQTRPHPTLTPSPSGREISVDLLQAETNGLPPRCLLLRFCCCCCCFYSRDTSHALVHAIPPFSNPP